MSRKETILSQPKITQENVHLLLPSEEFTRTFFTTTWKVGHSKVLF